MNGIGEQVVQAARGWIGTPYRHQTSTKGAGTDCLGLLRGVWREVRGVEPEAVPAYSMDWAEPSRDEVLWRAAERHLQRVHLNDEQPGDVLLFRMRDGAVAKHLGIVGCVGPQASFIHAYSDHAVVESPLSTPWQRRIAARFRFPEEKV
ncbi:NlpC/P60 family protein [Roseovarius albus]|uniref:NlpC/P60 family protein n=1 Tax=Roseovarius albus TaxID=1247867 RepID=A0A1X6ZAT4_9RHOB|nr:NlpC/P60 family protein [Roseovarius albus]SLN46207.1 NlpC/P60 family protein [Roseovarius albus]